MHAFFSSYGFRGLPLLLQALLLVAGIRCALCLAPFQKLKNIIGQWSAWRQQRVAAPPDQINTAVALAARCVPRSTCLVRALAPYGLLRRNGWPAQRHIGVARVAAGEFHSRAWGERERPIVAGATGADRYTPRLELS